MSQPTAEISYVSTMDTLKDFWVSGQNEVSPQFTYDSHICGYRMNVVDNTGLQVILSDGSVPFFPLNSTLDLTNDANVVYDNTFASKFYAAFYIQTNLTYYDSANNGWNLSILNRDNHGSPIKFRLDFYTSNTELFDSFTVPDLQIVVQTKRFSGSQYYLDYEETAIEAISSLGTGIIQYSNVHAERLKSDGVPPPIIGNGDDNTGSPLTISQYQNASYSSEDTNGVNLRNGSSTREPHVLFRRVPLHILRISEHSQGDLQNPLIVYVLVTAISIILLLIIYNTLGQLSPRKT
jgi:hypothetical protein